MATVAQQFGGYEHSSANTRIETNVHGRLEGAISITEPSNKVTSQAVMVSGSTYEVAQSLPSGEAFQQLELKLRKSYWPDFQKKLREAFGIAEGVPLAPLHLPMTVQVISEPFDEAGAPLPTVVTTYNVKFEGDSTGGTDRKSTDPMEVTIFLRQTSPAESN